MFDKSELIELGSALIIGAITSQQPVNTNQQNTQQVPRTQQSGIQQPKSNLNFIEVTPTLAYAVKQDNGRGVYALSIRIKDGDKTGFADEYMSCPAYKVKYLGGIMYKNGALSSTDHVDFPQWETINGTYDLIHKSLCN